MKRISLLPILIVVLLFSQCRKEPVAHTNPGEPIGVTTYNFDKGKTMKASFSGQIKNENGTPIPQAFVTIGKYSGTTDQNGFFLIENAEVNANLAYIKVDASNYFLGSRSVIPKQGMNHVTISLLSNTPTKTIASDKGGEVEVGNARIEIGPGFIDNRGRAYTGDVRVAMKYLDPEASNLLEIMPGDLIASSNDGDKILQTFGMIGVELTDPSGNKLQLANENEAVIRMKLSSTMLSKAPKEMPLWYFDENNGYWVPQGNAELINGELVGKVQHFSFWNCDVPRDYNRIDGIVKTKDGKGFSGVDIQITSSIMGRGGCKTSSSGHFGGRVASNDQFFLNLSYINSGVLKTLQLGPFNSDEVLDDIVIDGFGDLVTISGEMNGCDGKPMLLGKLFLNDIITIDVMDGKYSFVYPPNQDFTLRAYSAGSYSSKKQYQGSSSDITLPTDSFCAASTGKHEYTIYYELDGQPRTLTNQVNTGTGYSQTMNFVHFYRFNGVNNPFYGDFKIDIRSNYTGPGNYTIRHQNGDSLFLGDYYRPKCTIADSIHAEVKEYFIAANNHSIGIDFSGTVKVWNEQLQLYEIKEVRNGKVRATK